ncbi:MAG: F0F1 ATP synthase subunit C [Rickettsiaceae bacterium]|nr:F0F1 ATP synthase subunit C [Rickettsiaceae bacterium]
MDTSSFKYIGVGLTVIGMFGAALGVSNIFASLLNSMSRNPTASEQLQRMAFVGAGLTEAMGLFSFVLAILILFG